MANDDKKITLALPMEWALQKVLGPVLTEVGEDLKNVYAQGRDKIISAAYRKIPNPDDGKQANLRITRDVFWNGSFTEDEVCAEYFGGILASSRSKDGKNDEAIPFVDVCKSLSARQLRLHYACYSTLNKILIGANENINIASNQDVLRQLVYLLGIETFTTDLPVLHRQGLIHSYEWREDSDELLFISVRPTTFGIMLYAAAHNRFSEWVKFHQVDFGDFDGIKKPTFYAGTVEELGRLAEGLTPESLAQRHHQTSKPRE